MLYHVSFLGLLSEPCHHFLFVGGNDRSGILCSGRGWEETCASQAIFVELSWCLIVHLLGLFFCALALAEVFFCAFVKLFWCALVRPWTLMRGVGGWCIIFDVICYWNEIYILFAIFYSVVLVFNGPILRYACFWQNNASTQINQTFSIIK